MLTECQTRWSYYFYISKFSKLILVLLSESCSPLSLAADNSRNGSAEPPPKKQRVIVSDTVSDFLVPVKPLVALKNLLDDLPKWSYESQYEPTKLFTVWATFSGHQYKTTDPCNLEQAKTKLASQILHSYILNHNPPSNLSVSHHARIIEWGKSSLYIVGQENNVNESADGALYTLYELKPGIKMGVTSKLNAIGIPYYFATGINDILLHY